VNRRAVTESRSTAAQCATTVCRSILPEVAGPKCDHFRLQYSWMIATHNIRPRRAPGVSLGRTSDTERFDFGFMRCCSSLAADRSPVLVMPESKLKSSRNMQVTGNSEPQRASLG
jgi:hypothetical protein